MQEIIPGIILSILLITSPPGISASVGELTVPEGAEVVVEYDGTAMEWIWSVDTDAAGNIYVVCFPAENADMDPGPGEDVVSGDGNLLMKFDPEGNYLCSYPDRGFTDFEIDAEGNVYAVGETIRLRTYSEAGWTEYTTAYLRKYGPDGRVVMEINWDRTLGYDYNKFYVAVNDAGEIYIAGTYFGTVDFDPGEGEYVSTAEGQDSYLLKLDPKGEFQWAKAWGEGEFDWTFADTVSALEKGQSGEVYILGKMSPGSESTDARVFLSRFDGEGTLVWTREWGDWLTGADMLALENSSAIYVTGSFSGIVDLDPGDGETIRDGSEGWYTYLSKFDSQGNFLWAADWHSDEWMSIEDIATDGGGNVYTVGSFNETVDFDPGEGDDIHTAREMFHCAYVLSLSPDMEFRNALVEPVESRTYGKSIAMVSVDSLYLGYVTMDLRYSFENTVCRILKLDMSDFDASEILIED